MVYYFFHCVSLHAWPGNLFLFWIAVLPWLSACSVLTVVPFFFFKCVPLSLWCIGRQVLGYCIDS